MRTPTPASLACSLVLTLGLTVCTPAGSRAEGPGDPLPGYDDPPARAEPAWDPATTRAFIVSLATFEGEAPGHTSFTTDDRNDGAFADLLRARGVPADHVVMLLDGDATAAAVRQAFEALVAASRPGETLLFYFGSHGGYDAATNVHTFSAFDGPVPAAFFVDAIERGFRGRQALIFSDACYSGGLVELAAAGPRRVSYAGLSSTGPHNLAHSGWRFLDVILRGLAGRAEVDLDADGRITWGELGRFARRHMAFVAHGVPESIVTGRASDALVLARDVPRKPDPRVGLYRELVSDGRAVDVEVLDARGDRLLVHPTAGVTHERDAWVDASRLRERTAPRYADGAKVEVYDHGTRRWYPATVLGSYADMTLAHYDGYSAAWDEWFPPEGIRPLAP